jgi:hypothetical protein
MLLSSVLLLLFPPTGGERGLGDEADLVAERGLKEFLSTNHGFKAVVNR